MKAAYINQPGPAETIQYGEVPTPEPGAGQVLVKVEAVAINPIDTYIRGGAIQMELPKPYILGCDLAGTVEAVGDGVGLFKPGDRVWGSNQGLFGKQGTFAEYACVGEEWLYPLPEGVEATDAAAIALVGITAHLGLFRDVQLTGSDTLFVNGGTGGVGSTVVQMCKAVGAKVITTAGSDEKVELAKKLGADVAINYKTQDVDAEIQKAAPDGLSVWWETLRQPDFVRTVGHLAKRGRMVIMAGRDARPEFPVGPFYVKDLRLFGFAMFNASPDEQRAASDDINRWLKEGKLKPCIDRVVPLSEAAASHQVQEDSTVGQSGKLSGKIVLQP